MLSQLWRDWKAAHEIEWLMADETCMPACVCLLRILKGYWLITKTKKQKIVSLFCWCVVYLFLAENLYFESQTNRTLKTYPRFKNCFRRSGVASPKFLGGEMLDFRRITLFCLEKRLLKHKMTIFWWFACSYQRIIYSVISKIFSLRQRIPQLLSFTNYCEPWS